MGYSVEVEFDEFGWQLVREEAERQQVSVEDLIRHAALQFVADGDDKRMSRRVSPFKKRGSPPPARRRD